MRRSALSGLIVAIALSLLTARTEAWSAGSPFAGPPVGELQNEAWGRYLWGQYLRNNPLPPRQVHPQFPNWAWIAPSWQWNGVQWVWVPGYWIPNP